MGYRPSYADPDFWLKDCGGHYKYLATYVDDILSFSKNPMAVIEKVKKDPQRNWYTGILPRW